MGTPLIFNTVWQTVWIRIRHQMDTSYYLTSICQVKKIDIVSDSEHDKKTGKFKISNRLNKMLGYFVNICRPYARSVVIHIPLFQGGLALVS